MAENTQTMQKRESEAVDKVERTRSQKTFLPAVDIFETNNEIILKADMPGVTKDTVDITLEKGVLTIEGKVEHKVPKGYERVYAEYQVGDYQRSFTLSDTIDQDKISATVNNGVLTLTLPKAEPAKAKKIEIKS